TAPARASREIPWSTSAPATPSSSTAPNTPSSRGTATAAASSASAPSPTAPAPPTSSRSTAVPAPSCGTGPSSAASPATPSAPPEPSPASLFGPRRRQRGVDDLRAVQALRRRRHLAVGRQDRREAVAVPRLPFVDAPVGADQMVLERPDALRQPVPEPVRRVLAVHPRDRVQQRPDLVRLVLLQDRVDVEANRQADAAVLRVVDLHAAVARRRPRLLRVGPRRQLAVVRHQFALRRRQADGVEQLRFLAVLALLDLQQRHREVNAEPAGQRREVLRGRARHRLGERERVLALE